MHFTRPFRSRLLVATASLIALATATLYCSSGRSGATPGADGGGAPGVDGSSPDLDGGPSAQDANAGDAMSPPGDGASARDGGTAPSSRPNILFFLTDDLSWDLIPHMPSVQAMQKKGVTFDHYFVTDSLCCPSRSSIFTGKYRTTPASSLTRAQGGYQVPRTAATNSRPSPRRSRPPGIPSR